MWSESTGFLDIFRFDFFFSIESIHSDFWVSWSYIAGFLSLLKNIIVAFQCLATNCLQQNKKRCISPFFCKCILISSLYGFLHFTNVRGVSLFYVATTKKKFNHCFVEYKHLPKVSLFNPALPIALEFPYVIWRRGKKQTNKHSVVLFLFLINQHKNLSSFHFKLNFFGIIRSRFYFMFTIIAKYIWWRKKKPTRKNVNLRVNISHPVVVVLFNSASRPRRSLSSTFFE